MATEETLPEAPEQESNYTQAEQAHYQEIIECTNRVEAFARDMAETREAASAAKKAYDAAVLGLRDVIRRGPDMQGKLPFGREGDAWRDLATTELIAHGLPAATAEVYLENQLETLGKLSDLLGLYGTTWWHEVPGVGEGKAAKTEDAFGAFWRAHPEYCYDDTDADQQDANVDDTDEDE